MVDGDFVQSMTRMTVFPRPFDELLEFQVESLRCFWPSNFSAPLDCWTAGPMLELKTNSYTRLLLAHMQYMDACMPHSCMHACTYMDAWITCFCTHMHLHAHMTITRSEKARSQKMCASAASSPERVCARMAIGRDIFAPCRSIALGPEPTISFTTNTK